MADNNQFTNSFLSGAQPLSYLSNPPQSGNFTSAPNQPAPAQPFNPFSIEAIQRMGQQSQSQPLVPSTNVTGIGQQGPVDPNIVNQYIPKQNQVSFDPFRGQNIDESRLKAEAPHVEAVNPLRGIPGMPQTFSFLNPFSTGDMLKGAIETPERFFTSIKQIPAIVKAGGDPSAVPTKKEGEVSVKSYFREFLDMQSDLEEAGYGPKQAALAAFLSSAGSAILDATFVGGVLENAAKNVLAKVPLTPKEVQVAFDFLGKPGTIQEAETTYKALQRKFHPDMPTGDARISAQLNNAISVLRESGIPQQTGKVAQGARNIAETLLKPVSELTATPKGGTPFADVRGLLPEQAGYRPTQPFQPYRQPAFGLSIRDTGLAKESIGTELVGLSKSAQEAGTYEQFLSNIADNFLIQPEKAVALQEAGFTLRSFYDDAVKDIAKSQDIDNIVRKGYIRNADPGAKTAYQFYSPNIEENLVFDDAAKRLTSENQARYRIIGDDIDKQLGLKSESRNAIGDWSDGAENTVFNKITAPPDYETVRYSAALKGAVGNQKSVIPFMVEKGGPDTIYRFTIPTEKASIQELRKVLDEVGLQFRTLITTDGGTEVVVFDPGSSLKSNLVKIVKKYDAKVGKYTGRGEFLGGDTRAGGLKEYKRVISEYESTRGGIDRRPDGARGGQRLPDIGNTEPEIPDFIRRKLETIGGTEGGGVKPPSSVPPGDNAIDELEKLLEGKGEKGFFGKLVNRVRSIISPAKTLDDESRAIFDNWRTELLKSKQLANQESLKLKSIPRADGLQTITDYQAGVKTPYTGDIEQAFDDAYIEATERGFDDLNYVKNYLPQVYDNSLAEIKKAVATYMKAEGVPAKQVVEYLQENEALFGDPAAGLRTAAKFAKGKFIPDYKTAMEYGLTPKYDHPAELLAFWREQLETSIANKALVKQLSESGKILPSGMNPPGWKEVNIPFSALKVYAEPNLANVLNGIFADPAAAGLPGILARSFAGLSRKAQELALSAGIPKTTVNFYAMIQTLKQMTAGNVKAMVPFIRANFPEASANYFIKKHPVIMKMASNGIDLGNTIADWNKLYETSLKSRVIGDSLGEGFDKLFNEKTFNSFIPQLHIGLFEQAESRFLARGIPADKAAAMAADTVRASEGLIPDLGRSKLTKDTMTAIWFAPRFREGIIRTITNLFRSVSTEVKNPAFYMNRRLIAGLALTYATMNYLNKKNSGHYMWDNPEYHEFDLQYTVDKETMEKYGLEQYGIKEGDVIYTPWFPGFTSTIRNVMFGTKDILTGDFNKGQRELGSLFSISSKLIWEIMGNRDYFGNPIYNDNDTLANKLKKIALYTHLQVDHPFMKGIGEVIEGDKPLYQTFSKALELPLKYSSQDKISQQQFYNAIDELNADRAEARQVLQTKYNEIQALNDSGNVDGAQKLLDQLTDEEYEVYKDIKANDKRANTISQKSKIYDEYKKIQALAQEGKMEEAQAMVNAMSDEEYRAYELLKKQFDE